MLKQTRMDGMFVDAITSDLSHSQIPKFTLIVPSNAAWEKVQLDFSKAYAALQEGKFPQYVIIK